MRKAVPTICLIIYTVMFASMQPYIFMTMGRWFTYYCMLTAGCNDTFAYFAGKFFGKHHLIGLSPNKTIEGWIGGLLANIIATVFVVNNIMLKGTFWICAPQTLNYKLFEDFECAELDRIYHKQEFRLPIAVAGMDSILVEPAVLYSVIYTIFAATIAPYAGFFGSGLKRAVGIKDFSNTLPS